MVELGLNELAHTRKRPMLDNSITYREDEAIFAGLFDSEGRIVDTFLNRSRATSETFRPS
jgi:hypothetical protein